MPKVASLIREYINFIAKSENNSEVKITSENKLAVLYQVGKKNIIIMRS